MRARRALNRATNWPALASRGSRPSFPRALPSSPRGSQAHAARSGARPGVAQFAPVIESKEGVGVRGNGGVRRLHRQFAGHAQMEEEGGMGRGAILREESRSKTRNFP